MRLDFSHTKTVLDRMGYIIEAYRLLSRDILSALQKRDNVFREVYSGIVRLHEYGVEAMERAVVNTALIVDLEKELWINILPTTCFRKPLLGDTASIYILEFIGHVSQNLGEYLRDRDRESLYVFTHFIKSLEKEKVKRITDIYKYDVCKPFIEEDTVYIPIQYLLHRDMWLKILALLTSKVERHGRNCIMNAFNPLSMDNIGEKLSEEFYRMVERNGYVELDKLGFCKKCMEELKIRRRYLL